MMKGADLKSATWARVSANLIMSYNIIVVVGVIVIFYGTYPLQFCALLGAESDGKFTSDYCRELTSVADFKGALVELDVEDVRLTVFSTYFMIVIVSAFSGPQLLRGIGLLRATSSSEGLPLSKSLKLARDHQKCQQMALLVEVVLILLNNLIVICDPSSLRYQTILVGYFMSWLVIITFTRFACFMWVAEFVAELEVAILIRRQNSFLKKVVVQKDKEEKSKEAEKPLTEAGGGAPEKN